MSLFIYQIGNIVLNTVDSNISGVEINTSRSFKSTANQNQFTGEVFFTSPIRIAEPLDVQISGAAICSTCKPLTAQLSELLSIAGAAYVDIIAYIPNICCPINDPCSDCGGSITDNPVIWLHTYGLLKSVDRKLDISYLTDGTMPIDLSLTLNSYWMPLNQVIWGYTFNEPPSIFSIDSTDITPTSFPNPPTPFSGNSNNYPIFYKKSNPNFEDLYNPDNWNLFYGNNSIQSTWTRLSNQTQVKLDKHLWNYPPHSTYALTNLETSGFLEIIVDSEIIPFTLQTYNSQLDLSLLDTGLQEAGFDGLLPTDVLIVGYNDFKRSSVILRDNEVLNYLPLWNYDLNYPGQLIGLNNRVTIQATNIGQILSAWLHTFRGL